MKTRLFFAGLIILLITCSFSFDLFAGHASPFPVHPSYEVRQFTAHNGIRFEYSLLLPANYDRANRYEIVAVLCEVHQEDRAWEQTMKRLSAIDLERTILIVPKVPIGEEHWGTHPIHHGFNDLLKSVRKSHGKPQQKFHLVGLEAGHETAFWWTAASASLIASTSIINGKLWKEDRWDQKWYNNLAGSHVPIYAYEDQVVDKFDMSKFSFKQLVSVEQVLCDIEARSKS